MSTEEKEKSRESFLYYKFMFSGGDLPLNTNYLQKCVENAPAV
jgi:hypothetical protein